MQAGCMILLLSATSNKYKHWCWGLNCSAAGAAQALLLCCCVDVLYLLVMMHCASFISS
jgi:hypothetical protein